MSITIKQAFEKLTMVCGAALKNPFFVQRNLHDAFAYIAANIEEGGGGSTVEVTQIVESGTKIASITVDDTPTDLYAPVASGHTYSTTEQIVGKWIDGTTDVCEITVELDNALTLVSQAWTSTGIKSGSISQILNAGVYKYSDKLYVPVIATSLGGSSDDEIAFIQTRNQNIDIDAFTIRYIKSST